MCVCVCVKSTAEAVHSKGACGAWGLCVCVCACECDGPKAIGPSLVSKSPCGSANKKGEGATHALGHGCPLHGSWLQ